jgi:protein-disulfide isomerase
MGTQNFKDAPIRISVFSDFQCPYCQAVADQMPELIKEFGSKINIQYMFYPLDASCNSKMKGGMHPYACQAAYLAACDTEKFSKIHDYIFEKQSEINYENIKKWTKKFGLTENCLENKNVQDQIQQTLNAGDQFNLKSTPTIIINGKKLEGMIPTVHLKAILRSLIK